MAKRRRREDCKDPNPEYPTQLYCVRPPGHKRGPHEDVLGFKWRDGGPLLEETD